MEKKEFMKLLLINIIQVIVIIIGVNEKLPALENGPIIIAIIISLSVTWLLFKIVEVANDPRTSFFMAIVAAIVICTIGLSSLSTDANKLAMFGCTLEESKLYVPSLMLGAIANVSMLIIRYKITINNSQNIVS